MDYLLISKIVQVALSVILIILVLIQSKSTGLSSAFGGSGAFYRTRRGIERVVFVFTVVSGVLFVGNSLLLVLLG